MPHMRNSILFSTLCCNMYPLLLTICATILLTLLLPWSAEEDVGSTVGRTQSNSPIDIDFSPRGGTAAFPVFAYFLPFLCRPSVRPSSSAHLSFPLAHSHSPLSSPFLRLCTEIRFADPPLNEIPRGRRDVAPSPSIHGCQCYSGGGQSPEL